MKVTMVLNEGSHDLAFVSGLLTCCGAIERSRKALKELPSPIGEYFTRRLSRLAIGDYRLDQALAVGLPRLQSALESKDGTHLWLLLQCGGDSKSADCLTLLDELRDIWTAPLSTASRHLDRAVSGLRIIHVFDADSPEKSHRLAKFNSAYSSFYGLEFVAADTFFESTGFGSVMCCIIGGEAGMRTLEDVILPLARVKHASIMTQVESLLTDAVIAQSMVADRSSSGYKKALLNMVSQLRYPGASLATAIARNEYLHDKNQITSCPHCTKIFTTVTSMSGW